MPCSNVTGSWYFPSKSKRKSWIKALSKALVVTTQVTTQWGNLCHGLHIPPDDIVALGLVKVNGLLSLHIPKEFTWQSQVQHRGGQWTKIIWFWIYTIPNILQSSSVSQSCRIFNIAAAFFRELQFICSITQGTELQIRSSNPLYVQGLIGETDLSQIWKQELQKWLEKEL